ncbi:MAG: hypothetical protein BGO09_16370 [Bacteroidetes bacterium 47-18]|nr:MAG: hypothetical protein BGO09_16370 [Bacteroidetes bacterium 47-18]
MLMKHLLYSAFLLLCFSCTNTATTRQEPGHSDTAISIASPGSAAGQAKSRICWRGTLDSKIDILLQYQIAGEIVEGELIYLNTRAKKPIKIIGTVEEDQSLHLLEFEPSGNITGILTGTPTASVFEGSWFSPLTRKDLPMQLRKVDTFIATQSITTLPANNPEGDYYYQYSEEGTQGALLVRSVGNSRILFEIASVTDAPARNIADVSPDTVTLQGNSFIYTIPETDDCTFKVIFYRDFAYIKYTNGYCNGVFGHNASVDGIFYKQR